MIETTVLHNSAYSDILSPSATGVLLTVSQMASKRLHGSSVFTTVIYIGIFFILPILYSLSTDISLG